MPLTQSSRVAQDDPIKAARQIQRGLPVSQLIRFQKQSRLSMEMLAFAIQVPVRTLRRRMSQTRLPSDESDRLYRFASLFDKLLELFDGDARAAVNWLESPAKAFAGHTPLSMTRTSPGSRAVEDLIGQLEHGVFP
jgi:putative toxin-antitoxin system antitoxin component (TIGR02293 family)